jgi:hypothetical protein
VRNRHHAGCRVAIERAADRYTLICDGPYSAGKIHRANFLTQDSGLLRQTGGILPL